MPQVNYRMAMHRANIARFGEPRTLDELAEFVIKVINHQIEPNRVVGFKWNLRYTDQVSNTHSSPLEGVTNWGSDDDRPRGYPGFTGRVWIRYDREPKSFGSEPFGRTTTHTGTGGYGSYSGPWTEISRYRYENRKRKDYPEPQSYSWDYRFYLEDWPEIRRQVEQQQIWRALNGREGFTMDHEWEWHDPVTVRADADYINRMDENALA